MMLAALSVTPFPAWHVPQFPVEDVPHVGVLYVGALPGGELCTVLWQYRLPHVPYRRPAVLSVGARVPLATL